MDGRIVWRSRSEVNPPPEQAPQRRAVKGLQRRRCRRSGDTRSLTTTSRTKLKQLLGRLPSGTPVTSEGLARDGVSADLAVHYVRAGWLRRLARGVFVRPDSPLALAIAGEAPGWVRGFPACTSAASRRSTGTVRHFVEQQPRLRLYGLKACKLPDWFASAFPAECHRKWIFRSDATGMMHVSPIEGRAGEPRISAPERAFLELLSEVGVRQPIAEARALAESTYTFRASVLGDMLQDCTSVKTVRLCLQFGRELSLPWVKKLDRAEMPNAAAERAAWWAARSAAGEAGAAGGRGGGRCSMSIRCCTSVLASVDLRDVRCTRRRSPMCWRVVFPVSSSSPPWRVPSGLALRKFSFFCGRAFGGLPGLDCRAEEDVAVHRRISPTPGTVPRRARRP